MKKEPQPALTKRLLRVKEAAAYLGISPGKVRRSIHDGKLPYVQTEECGPWLLDVRDIESFIEGHKHTNE